MSVTRNEILGSMAIQVAKENASSADALPPSEGTENTSQEEQGASVDSGAAADAGQATPSGEPAPDSSSQDTTAAEGEGTPPAEEQGSETPDGESPTDGSAWQQEDAAFLETVGLKDIPANAHTQKLAKIARDNHAKVQELFQQQSTLNTYMAEVANALVNADVETLNQMAEEAGGHKLPFDLRTPEDQVKELASGFNEVYDALKAAFPQDLAMIDKALAPVHEKLTKRIGDLEKEMMTQRLTDEALKRIGGKPAKGQYMDQLKDRAEKNFLELKQKDPQAQKHFDALKDFFKDNVLVNPSKAYAMAPEKVNQLGKALAFLRDFEKVTLPELRKKWEEEAKLRKTVTGGAGGNKGVPPAKATKDPESNFNNYVGAKVLQRLGA